MYFIYQRCLSRTENKPSNDDLGNGKGYIYYILKDEKLGIGFCSPVKWINYGISTPYRFILFISLSLFHMLTNMQTFVIKWHKKLS